MSTKHIVLALGVVAVLAGAGCGGGSSKTEPTRTGPVVSLAPIAAVKPGEDFVASLRISNVQNLGGYQFTLDYDASKVTVVADASGKVQIEEMPFLGSTGRQPVCQNKPAPGALLLACATKEPASAQGSKTQTAPTAGPSGDGELLRIHLHAADSASGAIELQLAGVQVVDPLAQAIESSSSGTSVKVQ